MLAWGSSWLCRIATYIGSEFVHKISGFVIKFYWALCACWHVLNLKPKFVVHTILSPHPLTCLCVPSYMCIMQPCALYASILNNLAWELNFYAQFFTGLWCSCLHACYGHVLIKSLLAFLQEFDTWSSYVYLVCVKCTHFNVLCFRLHLW